MDVIALYRTERRETHDIQWRPGSGVPRVSRPTAPPAPTKHVIQVNSDSSDGMARLVNGSVRAGSTPEGLKFWLGQG